MRNRFFSTSILLVSLAAIVGTSSLDANAQEVKGPPTASKPGPIKAGESANIIVPKLRLRGVEAYHVEGTQPKDLRKVIFTFANWDKFPAKWFQPAAESTKLPPNPCRQLPTTTRMFLILHSEDGKISRCTPLSSKGDFYFLLDKEKPLPEFVYVDVTDRTNGLKFKSNLVSPSGGQIK